MATTYQSPGVFVEEVASGSAPIAGVGTSTAGFIGVQPPAASVTTPPPQAIGTREQQIEIGTMRARNDTKTFDLPNAPVITDAGSFGFFVEGAERTDVEISNQGDKATVKFTDAIDNGAKITGFFLIPGQPTAIAPAAARPVSVKLCTNFSEFTKSFDPFSTQTGQNYLAHAVFGFFRNGGTRCYVTLVSDENQVQAALDKFEAIDEIAIVAAPGLTTRTTLADIIAHCERLGDRVAILDTPETVADADGDLDTNLLVPTNAQKIIPDNSNYAALYFPWLEVFDPASSSNKFVPPSGHIAGIYARVDTQRGVFKAPANESVLGAVGLKYDISKTKQNGLNPHGINCIRNLNGNLRVWGARTLGGDANGEFRYINVRRLMNYLRESIDEGTQWTVFEPNSPDLWARIRRNINAFLLTVWRSGALFGTTPEQAFFVKCDAETNPPELREQGQVVTEIGVAIVKPAEFVIFRISQWSGGQ